MFCGKIVFLLMFLSTLQATVNQREPPPTTHWKERRVLLNISRDSPGKENNHAPNDNLNAQSANINRFVIGGLSVPKGKAPWQALLQLDGMYICGGSIISPTCILTAGHCVVRISKFLITLGSVNFNDLNKVIVTSSNSVIHEKYDPATVKNDIAIVKLKYNITFTPSIAAMRLPRYRDAKNTFVGVHGTACGFGLTENGGTSVSRVLNCLFLTVTDNKSCLAAYGALYVVNSTLCARAENNTALCNGDSGGPLVYTEVDGQQTQIGVVSFGSAVSCLKFPIGFARVTNYLDWIIKVCNVSVRP